MVDDDYISAGEFYFQAFAGIFFCIIFSIAFYILLFHIDHSVKMFSRVLKWDFENDRDGVNAIGYLVGVNGLLIMIILYFFRD